VNKKEAPSFLVHEVPCQQAIKLPKIGCGDMEFQKRPTDFATKRSRSPTFPILVLATHT